MKKIILLLILPLVLLNCSADGTNSEMKSSTGKGGSLSRFVILGDYMYVADHTNLNVFQIKNPKNPIKAGTAAIGFTSNIETLSSFGDYLYVGSQNGFFIYDVYKNPEKPKQLAEVQHFKACDPVVANETHAYVTLHTSEFNCGNTINQLQVYNITNADNPVMIDYKDMTSPKGLALYNDYLFVCDDEVKIYDISNPAKLNIITSISRKAFDIIIKDNLIVLISKNGIYQYRLDNGDVNKINELSTIKI